MEFGDGCGGGGGSEGGGVSSYIKNGAGGSDPEGGGRGGFEEAMDQPLTPDGMPGYDVLPPGKGPPAGASRRARGLPQGPPDGKGPPAGASRPPAPH